MIEQGEIIDKTGEGVLIECETTFDSMEERFLTIWEEIFDNRGGIVNRTGRDF